MINFLTKITEDDIEQLKHTTIIPQKGAAKQYSFGRKPNLQEHLQMLEKEFYGKSYLEYYHAGVITHIRRNIDFDIGLYNFKKIWKIEAEFLCNHLDSRWLVSACDTIIDHYDNPTEIGMAIAGSTFANTLKLYETERYCIQADKNHYDFGLVQRRGVRVPLFDGMSAFVVGRGDMVKNLINRIDNYANQDTAGIIFKELVKRANNTDTVYKRFYDMHKNGKTLWRKLDE